VGRSYNVKAEEVSDAEEEEDPVPMTFTNIKAEAEISQIMLGLEWRRNVVAAQQTEEICV
jgi:hypothetical protein